MNRNAVGRYKCLRPADQNSKSVYTTRVCKTKLPHNPPHFPPFVNLPLSPSLSLSSSSLNLSSSSANIVSPSRLSLGRLEGFLGMGAGRGEASRWLREEFWSESYAGGLGLLLPSPSPASRSSRSSESRDARSKPSSSWAICEGSVSTESLAA